MRMRGFSLMELTIVMAIVGILALVMVPSIKESTARKYVKEGMQLAEIAKTPIAMAWMLGAPLPASNPAAGLPPPEKIVNNVVSRLEVDHGVIHITFGNTSGFIKGKILSLRPAVVEDALVVPVAWICGNAEVPDQMTVKGTNRTNIEPAYLPVECRALKVKPKTS